MTISSTGVRFSYSGNGSTTVFSFPRQFFLSTDLDVYLVDNTTGVATLQTIGSQYSVSGAGSPSGGTVTMVTAPATGKTLLILRDTAATQGLDLDSVTAFPMASVEAAIDRAMMAIDEDREKLTHTLRSSDTDASGALNTLPAKSARASKVLYFDATGQPSVLDPSAFTGPTGPTGPSGGPTGATGATGATGPAGASNFRDLETVAALLADTTLTYTTGTGTSVASGDFIRTRKEDFSYQVAASGASDYHLATAGGVRLYCLPTSAGYYNFMQMNPDNTGVSDCWSKLDTLLNKTPVYGSGFYVSTIPIHFPVGTYYMSAGFELKRSVKLFGQSSGQPSSSMATLKFAADSHGFVVNRYNTLGGTTVTGTTGADSTTIEGLNIFSNGGTDTSKHGIYLRARASIKNVQIDGFPGNGINIVASAGAGGAGEGNANNWFIQTARITNNHVHGIYVNGADVNAGVGIGIDVTANRQWGIFDSSFLGNTWMGCHADRNGYYAAGPQGAYASYGGAAYQCVPDINSAGTPTPALYNSTTPGTNSAIWKSVGATNSYCIAWTGSNPAGTFQEGGAYKADNPNSTTVFLGCYQEGGQYTSWIAQACMTLNCAGIGLMNGASLGSSISGITSNAGITTKGNSSTTTDYMNATLGGNPANGDILNFQGGDGTVDTGGPWRIKRNGDGWTINHQNTGSRTPFSVYGTTGTYPYKMVLGDMALGGGSTVRLFGRVTYSTTAGVVVPTSGSYTKGDIYVAPNPNAGDYIGWVCTTTGVAGSTAVFKSFGAILP